MQFSPQIFSGSGKFIEPPDKSKFTPQAIKRLDTVRAAYNAAQDQERAVADAQIEVTAALEQVAEAERIVKPFGSYDFHRLWLETVKGR
jgi:hypothetical protein